MTHRFGGFEPGKFDIFNNELQLDRQFTAEFWIIG